MVDAVEVLKCIIMSKCFSDSKNKGVNRDEYPLLGAKDSVQRKGDRSR